MGWKRKTLAQAKKLTKQDREKKDVS